MGVAGQLKTIGLAEVFQNIAFNHLTGTLTLTHGEAKAHVAIEDGRIRAIGFSDRTLDYAELARQAGVATDELLDKATSVKRRRTLKAFLRASGPFDEERYDAAVASQVQEEILPLFGWAGSFSFEEGATKERLFDKEQRDCAIDLDAMGVAMEAARRHDEWQGLAPYVPSDDEILVMPSGRPEVEPDHERLLDLLDGTRTLGEVVQQARLKKYEVLKTVGQLVGEGWLHPATPDLLRELAAQAKAIGEINQAARRLEIALEKEPLNLEVRRDLVHVYERAGRPADAARELATVADELTRRGDAAGAREALERATVLAPRDLDVLEHLFELHVAAGEKALSLKAGRRLAEALAAQGMHEDARPLYERLLREHDENQGLREAFADCLLALDDAPGAVQHLLWVAVRVNERGEHNRALRRLRRILELSPDCAEATELVERIESGEEELKRVRRRRRLVAACIAPVIGLLLWQVGREYVAQSAFHAAQHASVGALALDNADTARLETMGRYAEVCRDHPYTRSAALARDTLRALIVSEAGRIRALCRKGEGAESIADVDYTLGRAEALIKGLDAILLPEDLSAFWQGARDPLLASIRKLRDH